MLEPKEPPEYINQLDHTGPGMLKPIQEDTPDKVLQKFADFDHANTVLWNSLNNGKPPMGVSVTSAHDCVTAVLDTVSTIDKYGKAIMKGSPCVVCGKQVPFMPSNGYCSVECALKDILRRIALHRAKEKPYQKYIDAINDTLQFLNLVINMIAELPQKIKDIARVPPEFANFLLIRVNIIFLKIKIMINDLMVIKNNAIIMILKPCKLGVIDDFMASLFQPINQVLQVVSALQQALDAAFAVALKAMQLPILTLPAGSFAWIATPRSMINLPGKLYVEVPGPNVMPIASPINALNVNTISATIQKMFPPIIPLEYFMEPDLFDVRLALSDQSDIVKQTIETLEMFLKLNAEYLPRYKDLKISNPWFIVACFLGWGPKGRMSFGSIINPFV